MATRETLEIPGFGSYEYDLSVYADVMTQTVAQLRERVHGGCEGMESGTRTKVNKLRKNQLAAMVAEWDTAARDNEATATRIDAMAEAGTLYSQDAIDDLTSGYDTGTAIEHAYDFSPAGPDEFDAAATIADVEADVLLIDQKIYPFDMIMPKSITETDVRTSSGLALVALVQFGSKLVWGKLIAVVNRRTKYAASLLATVEIAGVRRLLNADDVLVSNEFVAA